MQNTSNIIETSLTISGIVYVVDPGLSRSWSRPYPKLRLSNALVMLAYGARKMLQIIHGSSVQERGH
jgi:hypothetical protein